MHPARVYAPPLPPFIDSREEGEQNVYELFYHLQMHFPSVPKTDRATGKTENTLQHTDTHTLLIAVKGITVAALMQAPFGAFFFVCYGGINQVREKLYTA